MNYRELNAVELLKVWRSIVNKYTSGGRDAKMLKEALALYTPVQILLGFYHYKESATISIPQFLKQYEDWLEIDEILAEIEFCRYIRPTPPEYWVYRDYEDAENATELTKHLESRTKLREWANEVLA